MDNKFVINEIRKANKLSIKIFNYLYKLNDKKLNKTVYRISEINDILTNLEIELECEINEWL